jgi:hypothetical protein
MPKAEEKEDKNEEDGPQNREDVLIGDPFNWMLENEHVSSMLTVSLKFQRFLWF